MSVVKVLIMEVDRLEKTESSGLSHIRRGGSLHDVIRRGHTWTPTGQKPSTHISGLKLADDNTNDFN